MSRKAPTKTAAPAAPKPAPPTAPPAQRPAARQMVEEFCQSWGIVLARGISVEKTSSGGIIAHPMVDFLYADEIKQPEA